LLKEQHNAAIHYEKTRLHSAAVIFSEEVKSFVEYISGPLWAWVLSLKRSQTDPQPTSKEVDRPTRITNVHQHNQQTITVGHCDMELDNSTSNLLAVAADSDFAAERMNEDNDVENGATNDASPCPCKPRFSC
jgi:hypothetical protein